MRIGNRRQQRGITMFVALVMLVVLTLFAVTAFNLSSVNLKIVGSFQQQRAADSTVRQAMEQVMSTVTIFTTPAQVELCIPSGTPAPCASTEQKVTIERPRCNYTTAAKGYTKKVGELTPEDTNWDVRATYTDSASGATAAIVQGVAVRMLAGNCPTWPY